jgi:hypothetical protein
LGFGSWVFLAALPARALTSVAIVLLFIGVSSQGCANAIAAVQNCSQLEEIAKKRSPHLIAPLASAYRINKRHRGFFF